MKIIIQNIATKEHIKFENKKDLLKWCYANADDEAQLLIDMLNLPSNEPITNVATVCKLCLPKGYIRVCDMPTNTH